MDRDGIGKRARVEVWDIANNKLLFPPRTAHAAPVRFIQFSPQGNRFVTVSTDAKAMVWDAATGYSLVSLDSVLSASFNSVSFNSDGTRIVIVSGNGMAQVWDTTGDAPGAPLFSLEGHTDAVWSAQFDQKGAHIVTASEDRTVKVWNATTGDLLFSLDGHTDAVRFASFSPDDTRIVTVSKDGTAKIWSAATGRLLFSFAEHTDTLRSAHFTQDSSRLVTISQRMVKGWDVAFKTTHSSNEIAKQVRCHVPWNLEIGQGQALLRPADPDPTACPQ
jgi:WD40 repeat protein